MVVNGSVEKSTIRIAWGWFGSHVLAGILCAIINFSIGMLLDQWYLQVLVGFLSLFLYSTMLGGCAWHLGNQDFNRVKFGRREIDLKRGFKVGAVMSIPLYGFGIALILANAELLPNFYVIYKVCNAYLLPFINVIDKTSFGVLSAYLTEVSWGSIIGVVVLNVIPCIITGVHYILGYKNIVLMDNIMYKKKK